MKDPLDALDPEKETDYDRQEDSDSRFTRLYDDVFDPDGNLIEPTSVLDDPFVTD